MVVKHSRVLLVDDDLEILRFLATLLDLEGFSTITATSAAEGLALASADTPAAILVDLAMPDVDGLELCRRLRSSGLASPILMVSARPGQDLVERAQMAGANEFIRKPFDNEELVARVRHWAGSPA